MTFNSTRIVRLLIGDSLRSVAAREMGDALRWIEIAELNGLRPPYVVESINSADRVRGTVIFGDSIRVPVGRITRAPQSFDDVLGVDVALVRGDLPVTDTGDYALVAGADNLRQALAHRVKTALGEMITHPRYGCNAHVALGMRLRSLSVLMLAGYVKRAMQDEPRVATINRIAPRIRGDAVEIYASITPVTENTSVDLNLVFPTVR